MKLQTSIKPRLDGVVLVTGNTGCEYVFRPDEAGDMVAEVTENDDVVQLLALGDFFPADCADNPKALEILKSVEGVVDPDGHDLEDDDQSDPNAAPIEANTPVAAPGELEPALNKLPIEANTPPVAPIKVRGKKR